MLDSEYLLVGVAGCRPQSFHLPFFTSLTDATIHRSSPQAQRRDIGLAVTHRLAAASDLFRLLVMLCLKCLSGITLNLFYCRMISDDSFDVCFLKVFMLNYNIGTATPLIVSPLLSTPVRYSGITPQNFDT